MAGPPDEEANVRVEPLDPAIRDAVLNRVEDQVPGSRIVRATLTNGASRERWARAHQRSSRVPASSRLR
jgi:hypothetical protein